MIRLSGLIICCIACYLLDIVMVQAAVVGANRAAAVLCDVILLIRGRIGRALTVITIMGMAVAFMYGNISWQKIMVTSTGIAILFAAESIAYVILPSTIKGLKGTSPSGKVFNPSSNYTPEELVREVCPELSRIP